MSNSSNFMTNFNAEMREELAKLEKEARLAEGIEEMSNENEEEQNKVPIIVEDPRVKIEKETIVIGPHDTQGDIFLELRKRGICEQVSFSCEPKCVTHHHHEDREQYR